MTNNELTKVIELCNEHKIINQKLDLLNEFGHWDIDYICYKDDYDYSTHDNSDHKEKKLSFVEEDIDYDDKDKIDNIIINALQNRKIKIQKDIIDIISIKEL
jgi:hypothetical protein